MNVNIIALLNADISLQEEEQTTQLSLVGASKYEMQIWVASLSMLRVGETAKQLYITLQELLVLDIAESLRFELIEVLRPAIYTIIESLSKHYINQNILLDQRSERIAGLAQQLRVYTAMIYRHIALHTTEQLQGQTFGLFAQTKKKSMQTLMAQSIHRGLTELFRLFADTKILYLSTYKGQWTRLHELYHLAYQSGLATFSFRDENLIYGQTLTIEEVYLSSVLISACHTNKLRQAEIKKICQLCEVWVSLMRISNQPTEHAFFLVDTSIDASPMYISRLKETSHNMYYIDVHRLHQHFENLVMPDAKALNPAEQKLLSPSLRQHLLHCLRAPAGRTSERYAHAGTIEIALGLIGSHFQISDQQPFEEVIQSKQLGGEPMTGQIRASSADLDVAYTAQDEQVRIEATQEYLNTYECEIINMSIGGYCIRWTGAAPTVLRSGEVIAVRERGSSHWSVGLIRWVQQQLSSGAEFGVEILSPRGKACGVRALHQQQFTCHYMRAILLPEMKELNRATSLIAPTQAMISGQKILIRLGKDEVRAQLTRELMVTQSFSQFEFVIIQAERIHQMSEQTQAAMQEYLATEDEEMLDLAMANDDMEDVWRSL